MDRRRSVDRTELALGAFWLALVASAVGVWFLSGRAAGEVEVLRSRSLAAYEAAWEVRYLDEVLTHSAARYAATADPAWRERYDDGVAGLDAALARASELATPEALAALDGVAAANTRLIELETAAFEAAAAGDTDTASALLTGEYADHKADYAAGLDAFFAAEQQKMDEALAGSARSVRIMRTTGLSVLGPAIVASMVLVWARRRQRLARLQAEADQARTAATLQDLLGSLAATAEHSARTSADISAVSDRTVTEATEAQVAVDQLRASIAEIAAVSRDAAAVAQGASDAVDNAHATVARLTDSSTAIGEVLDVIAGIASQINLLALNATIEAARAGETGKGFTVVATQVKELAGSTATAVDEIRAKVERLLSDSSAARSDFAAVSEVVISVASSQESIADAVEEHNATTSSIGRIMTDLVDSSERVNQVIVELATAAARTADEASVAATTSLGQR